MEKELSVELAPPACQPLVCEATKATPLWPFKRPKDCPQPSQDFLYSKLLPRISLPLFSPWLHLLPHIWIVLFAQHNLGKGTWWAVKLPATANPIPDKSTSNILAGFEPESWAKQLSLCHGKVSPKQRRGRRWGFGQLGSGTKKRGRE